MHAQARVPNATPSRDDEGVDLLQAIGQGDRSAMDRFYRLFQQQVFRFAHARLNDPGAAADVLNETMLKVWREAARYRGESSPGAWVQGIAFHGAMDRLRGSRRHWAESLDPSMPDDDAVDMSVVLERMEDIRRVRDAISKLSVIQRTALHLAFHDEMQYSQMAKVLGCPEGTAKTRVFHAKQALKRLLVED